MFIRNLKNVHEANYKISNVSVERPTENLKVYLINSKKIKKEHIKD